MQSILFYSTLNVFSQSKGYRKACASQNSIAKTEICIGTFQYNIFFEDT